jgi:carbonic anhydrase/acetyltransferase-like protein (isoleucine patch superfamily)
VLPGAIVGNGALVGAQALVSPNAIIPDYARALGVPARISEKAVEPGFSDPNVEAYLMAAKLYKTELVEIELKDAY